MPDEQVKRIKGYTKSISDIANKEQNAELLTYVISEVFDRVSLYLNTKELDTSLERVVARIVAGILNQTLNSKSSTSADVAISSVSDNGQSVSYANEVKNYLATTEDNEIFAGNTKLLARYRRINVLS